MIRTKPITSLSFKFPVVVFKFRARNRQNYTISLTGTIKHRNLPSVFSAPSFSVLRLMSPRLPMYEMISMSTSHMISHCSVDLLSHFALAVAV